MLPDIHFFYLLFFGIAQWPITVALIVGCLAVGRRVAAATVITIGAIVFLLNMTCSALMLGLV